MTTSDERYVELTSEIARIKSALKLARKYIVKAHIDGAYRGCAWGGDKALEMIDATLGKKGIEDDCHRVHPIGGYRAMYIDEDGTMTPKRVKP